MNRNVAAGIGGVAAIILLIGLLGPFFSFSKGDNSVSIKLSGMKVCEDSDCETMEYSKMSGDPKDWGTAAQIAQILGFVILAGLLATAGTTAAGSGARKPLGWVTFGLFILLLGMTVLLLVGKPNRWDDAGIGLGGICLMLSVFAGIVGSILMAVAQAGPPRAAAAAYYPQPGMPAGYPPPGAYPQGQPMPMGMPMGQPMPGQPMPGQPMPMPMGQPMPAACNRCGSPTRWIAEHSRHWCDRCQAYL